MFCLGEEQEALGLVATRSQRVDRSVLLTQRKGWVCSSLSRPQPKWAAVLTNGRSSCTEWHVSPSDQSRCQRLFATCFSPPILHGFVVDPRDRCLSHGQCAALFCAGLRLSHHGGQQRPLRVRGSKNLAQVPRDAAARESAARSLRMAHEGGVSHAELVRARWPGGCGGGAWAV